MPHRFFNNRPGSRGSIPVSIFFGVVLIAISIRIGCNKQDGITALGVRSHAPGEEADAAALPEIKVQLKKFSLNGREISDLNDALPREWLDSAELEISGHIKVSEGGNYFRNGPDSLEDNSVTPVWNGSSYVVTIHISDTQDVPAPVWTSAGSGVIVQVGAYLNNRSQIPQVITLRRTVSADGKEVFFRGKIPTCAFVEGKTRLDIALGELPKPPPPNVIPFGIMRVIKRFEVK